MKILQRTFIAMLLIATLVLSVSAAEETGPNLSLGGSAEAVSVWDDMEDYEASKAIDGDITTRWNPNREDNLASWIMIDLGTEKVINRMVIYEFSNRTLGYNLEVSKDKTNWTSAKSGDMFKEEDSGDDIPVTIDFDAIEARYFRVSAESTTTVSYYEIELYNVGNVSLTPPEPEPQEAAAVVEESAAPTVTPQAILTITAPQTSDSVVQFIIIGAVISVISLFVYRKKVAKI